MSVNSTRLREFENACDEVDRQFTDVQSNLVTHIRTYKERTNQVREIQGNQEQFVGELKYREDMLSKYAETLAQKVGDMDAERETEEKRFREMKIVIDGEQAKKSRRLAILTRKEIDIEDTMVIMKAQNTKMYRVIMEKQAEAEELAVRLEMADAKVKKLEAQNSGRVVAAKGKRVEQVRLGIRETEVQTLHAESAISELEIACSQTAVQGQTMVVELEKVKKLAQVVEVRTEHHYAEVRETIRELLYQHRKYEQRVDDLTLSVRSTHNRNNIRLAELRGIKRAARGVKERAEFEQRKVERMSQTSKDVKKEVDLVKKRITVMKEDRERRAGVGAESRSKVRRTNTSAVEVECELGHLRIQLQREKGQLAANEKMVHDAVKALPLAMALLSEIEKRTEESGRLEAKLTELSATDIDSVGEFASSRRMDDERRKIETTIDVWQQQVFDVNVEAASVRTQVMACEEEVEMSRIAMRDIRVAMREASDLPSGSWASAERTNAGLKEEVSRRSKRMADREREVESLRSRISDTENRIDTIKRKIEIMRTTLSNTTLPTFCSNSKDLSCVRSLKRCLDSEVSVWLGMRGGRAITALQHWEKQLALLVDEARGNDKC